jgi:hypothetical protein
MIYKYPHSLNGTGIIGTMKLKITNTNFTTRYDWMFKLSDEKGEEFYIMNDSFYNNRHLKSPLSRKELDHFDTGQWIIANSKVVDGLNVITELY